MITQVRHLLMTLLIFLMASILACTHQTKRMELIFSKVTVETPFFAKADRSVDIELFKSSYSKYPERWNIAFNFLSRLNVDNPLPTRIDLSADVFALGSEYETKEPENGKYESHRKFADIQYVISGTELIGLTREKTLEILSPYNEDKDIEFYDYNGGEMLEANQERFFIFFPEDKHKPSLQNGKREKVRKIVIKVKLD